MVKDKKFDFVHKKWRTRGFIAFNQPKSEQVDFDEQRDIPVNRFAKCYSQSFLIFNMKSVYILRKIEYIILECWCQIRHFPQ